MIAVGSSHFEMLESLLERAAARGEVTFSVARALFCLLVLVRFLAIGAYYNDQYGLVRSVVTIPLLLAGIGFSCGVIHRFLRDRSLRYWFEVSVLVDVTLCFGTLLPDSLFPGDRYQGIILGPDVHAFLVLLIATGLRLSVRLVLLAGALTTLATGTLVLLDFTISPVQPEYGASEASLFLLLLAAATALASTYAWRTRSLASAGAREASKHERTLCELKTVLHGQHDANNLVGSLMLKFDRVLGPALGADVRDDLKLLSGCLRRLQNDAAASITLAEGSQRIDLGSAVRESGRSLMQVYPRLMLVVPGAERVWVEFSGGRQGIHRALHNLVKNAFEGNGVRGANQVSILLETAGAWCVLSVEDDGPGINVNARLGTTKQHGSGVGLRAVRALVEASHGDLVILPRARGGIRVEMRLPVVG